MSGPAISWPSPWVEAIGWMLVHSLWQGTGVAMAMALVLCVLRRAPARARYLAACAAMLLIVALPVATVLRSGHSRPSPRPHREAIAGPAVVGSVSSAALPPAPVFRAAGPRAADRLTPMLPAVVAMWMAGVGVFSVRLLGGWLQARRWVRLDTRPLAGPWIDRVERLKERLGVGRAVALLESARVEVPMVIGWLRPAILVPFAALAGLSAAELEAILAHELAHIRRHDYLINLAQCVAEVLVFYHPATWWISGVIRRERESCCDDLAVAACRDRVVYARALAAMEGLRVPAFSPSPAANGGVLLARVRRILKPQEESMNPVRILAGLAVCLAVAPLWLARADDDRPASAATVKATIPPSPAGSLPDLAFPVDGPGERQVPFPNRSFADVITSVDEARTGRFLVGAGWLSAGAPRAWGGDASLAEIRAWKDLDDRTPDAVHRGLRRVVAAMKLEAGPAAADELVAVSTDPAGIPDKPPTDAEVWAEFLKSKTDSRPYYETRRDNVRIAVEKVGKKVAEDHGRGLSFQIIHRYYKCTVTYDETRESYDPIPLRNVDHKVEVIDIDRPYFRDVRVARQAARDRAEARIGRLIREIEQLKRTRQGDRRELEQILDRLIKELEGLKRELRDDPEGAGARSDAPRPGAFSFSVGGIY